MSGGGFKSMLKMHHGSSVDLYYDGSVKAQTSATGFDITGIIKSSSNKKTKTANYTITVDDFAVQRSEIAVGNNAVTLTLPAIGDSAIEGMAIQINLYNASGSITLNASAVTLIDSEANPITAKSAIDVKAVEILYDHTASAFKIIGKYTV